MKLSTTIFFVILIKLTFSQSQDLYVPLEVIDAYTLKTRDMSGKPGINYFQNFSDYKINVKIDPSLKTVIGNETIVYYNNSLDTLNTVVFDLHQNLFEKGQIRARNVHKDDVGKLISVDSVFIAGNLIDMDFFGKFWGTKMKIQLQQNLLPEEKLELHLYWHYSMAIETKIRAGVYENNSMFIAYWYPQISVYDDIDGWDYSSYDGLHEFYGEFSNYTVEIELPENYLVWATGVLQNPKEVLAKKIYKKYNKALVSDKSIGVITTKDLEKGIVTEEGQNHWLFKADSVTDFAFGLSNTYCWDMCSVKRKTGERFSIHTAYNPTSRDYDKANDISRNVIMDFTDNLVSAYPFPQLSMFNGAGAMEFPMITNIGTEPNLNDILFTISHEFMHNYFPFLVASNQQKYAWIDEGLATYLTSYTQQRLGDNFDPLPGHIRIYESYAGKEQDEILMTSSHYLDNRAYVINSYFKSCTAFYTLHQLIGDEKFTMSIHDFIQNWKYKHPIPYDLFNTFNRVSGEDLNWFWDQWFFQKGYPDLAIDTLIISDSVITVNIKNIGGYPVPINVKIYSKSELVDTIHIDASVWKDKNSYTMTIDYNPTIDKIELGDALIPDVDQKNNVHILN